jgi:hypothetical protein
MQRSALLEHDQVAVKKIRRAEKSHVSGIGSEGLLLQDLQNSGSLHKNLAPRATKTASKQLKKYGRQRRRP